MMMKPCISVMIGVLVLSFSACGQQTFDGSRVGNDHSFILDYKVLNDRLEHEMTLPADTTLEVDIEHEKGQLDIEIKNSQHMHVYKGKDLGSGSFSVTLPQDDTYVFLVEGHEAEGAVSFEVVN